MKRNRQNCVFKFNEMRGKRFFRKSCKHDYIAVSSLKASFRVHTATI